MDGTRNHYGNPVSKKLLRPVYVSRNALLAYLRFSLDENEYNTRVAELERLGTFAFCRDAPTTDVLDDVDESAFNDELFNATAPSSGFSGISFNFDGLRAVFRSVSRLSRLHSLLSEGHHSGRTP